MAKNQRATILKRKYDATAEANEENECEPVKKKIMAKFPTELKKKKTKRDHNEDQNEEESRKKFKLSAANVLMLFSV